MIELYGPGTAYGGPVHAADGQPDARRLGDLPVRRRLRRHLHPAAPGARPVQAIGDPELIDGTFARPDVPLEQVEELAAKIYLFSRQRTRRRCSTSAARYKVPIGVAVTPADLLAVGQPGRAGLLGRGRDRRRRGPVPGRPFPGLGWRHLERLHEPGEDTRRRRADWLGGAAAMKQLPLEGVRVADLTMMWAGPYATSCWPRWAPR